MSTRRWDPFTVLARLDDDFDELVRRTWGAASGPAPSGRTLGYVPAIDMATDGSDVVIRLELPGLDIEKDVEIEVHDGRLTISGERRDTSERKDASGKVLVRELRYGSFRRDFALPEGVGADEVSAHYDKGMLEVRVRNVTRPVEAPRKISVTAGTVGEGHKTIASSAEEQS